MFVWREINVPSDDLQDINVWVELGVIVLIILTLPVIRPRTGDDSYQLRQHLTLTHFHHRKQTVRLAPFSFDNVASAIIINFIPSSLCHHRIGLYYIIYYSSRTFWKVNSRWVDGRRPLHWFCIDVWECYERPWPATDWIDVEICHESRCSKFLFDVLSMGWLIAERTIYLLTKVTGRRCMEQDILIWTW